MREIHTVSRAVQGSLQKPVRTHARRSSRLAASIGRPTEPMTQSTPKLSERRRSASLLRGPEDVLERLRVEHAIGPERERLFAGLGDT